MASRQDSQDFFQIVQAGSGLEGEAIQEIVRFRELLLEENEVQNLTRIIGPSDFFEGHVVDCQELLKSGFLGNSALDLGSGGGVPGLLTALIGRETNWVLTDSEGRKAQFLEKTAEALGLSTRVEVFGGRAEVFLRKHRVESVVARAVGKVEKIFGWIQECSTWNKLILLKGPGWIEEWQEFEGSKFRKKLRVVGEHRYQVGASEKSRVIIALERT